MPRHPCLACGRLVAKGRRCPCQTTTTRGYGQAWQAQATATLKAWRLAHGNLCPGWHQETHPAADLVVDHDLGVLCRSCNARKAATADKVRAAQRRQQR